jgi:hypothetical protein
MLVQRMVGERPILVERTILACAAVILRRVDGEKDPERLRLYRQLLDDMELVDKKQIME